MPSHASQPSCRYLDIRYRDILYRDIRYRDIRYRDIRYRYIRCRDLRCRYIRCRDIRYRAIRYRDTASRYGRLHYGRRAFHMSIHVYVHVSAHMSIHVSIRMSIHMSVAQRCRADHSRFNFLTVVVLMIIYFVTAVRPAERGPGRRCRPPRPQAQAPRVSLSFLFLKRTTELHHCDGLEPFATARNRCCPK